MKIPSLGTIGSVAAKTAAKYPFPLALSALTAAVSVYAQESSGGDDFQLVRIALTAALGAALFLAAQLMPFARKWKLGLFALIAALLIIYLFNFEQIESDHYAFALHCLAAVAAVIIAPFAFRRDKSSEVWEWGKSLFLRAALSALYTLVLFGGVALALASIEQLFGVHWKQWFHIEIYIDLWFILAFFIGPWIFLAGIPDAGAESEPKPFPRSVRAFALYVLLPIAGVYLLILYAYAINILIQWNLPNGWVTSLIMTYSGVGLVTLLLLYPLLRSGELGARFARAPRIFFLTLLPLLVLQYFAISRRLADYGLTENRYFVIVAMIWLAGISLYYIAEGFSRIKIIPVSLFFTLILTSFGPWSAFALAEASQTNRFMNVLREAGAIKNGKLVKGVNFTKKQAREINRLNWYLGDHYGYRKLNEELSQYGIALKRPREDSELIKALGSPSLGELGKDYIYEVSVVSEYDVSLDGADIMAAIHTNDLKSYSRTINLKGKDVRIYCAEKDERTYLAVSGPNGEARFDLSQIADKISAKGENKPQLEKPVNEMTFTASTAELEVKLMLQSIYFKYDPEVEIRQLRGMLLIKSL